MRPLRTKPTFTPPIKRSLKAWLKPLILVGALGIVVFLGLFYQTHVLPNVSLASVGVGNRTLVELEAIAQKQFQKMQFRFVSSSKTVTASAQELGVTLNVKKTAEQAYNARRHLFDAPLLWQSLNTSLIVEYNREHIEQFLARTFSDEFLQPTDATLQFDENLNEFGVVEGKFGRGFAVAEVIGSFNQLVREPSLITMSFKNLVEPERTAVSVAKTGDEVNAIIRLSFSFLYQNKVMYVAEPNEIAAWLGFKPGNKPGQLTIAYNRQAIANFLETKVTKSLNDFYGPEGSIPAADLTVAPATESLRLQAVDDLINDIISAADKKTDIGKELKVINK